MKKKRKKKKIIDFFHFEDAPNTATITCCMPCGYIAERKNIEADWIIKKC